MLSNNIHSLAADEQEALVKKFGRNVKPVIVKVEAGGPVVRVGNSQYILIDMDDHISVQKYQPEPAVKLPHTNRSIEDLLG